MKEKIKFVVNEPWYWLIMSQIMFFGGLFVAGVEGYAVIKLIIGLVWFGGASFWMSSMMNKWWLKYKK